MQPERRPSPDRSLEALEARLRALPSPEIPADLEARLLAAIPAVVPSPRRRRAVWLGLTAALAAALLLGVFIWQGRFGKRSVPEPEKSVSVQPVRPNPSPNPAEVRPWQEARRDLNAEETPAFRWPLAETEPIRETKSIPRELLD
ncbi:MAG TPA: hypothetical protein VGZ47_02150 [Gemmataceae bacterium]|jgi:hypothetical protein|nr:hypothetical protein [Gemmataceae bacterium]